MKFSEQRKNDSINAYTAPKSRELPPPLKTVIVVLRS